MFRLFIHLSKPLLRACSAFYEWFLGPRSLTEITSPRASIEAIAATSIEGFTTTIHCQEHLYLCRYDRWYVRNRVFRTYYVFATVQGVASPRHIEACSMECSFPKLLHPWMPSASQKEAAIEAYLDLLIDRLKRGQETFVNTIPQVR